MLKTLLASILVLLAGCTSVGYGSYQQRCSRAYLVGCASYYRSPPMSRVDEKAGYRFHVGDTTKLNTNRVFVVLALSGGGTRAAAFSYGVLRELERAQFTDAGNGQAKTLLDEVDVMSSVSGGSFPAAYYALWGRDSLANFERDFLHWKAQGNIVRSVLFGPRVWGRLASPTYSRIDLAADRWNSRLFRGATYGDLMARKRPYLIVNATDMSRGSQFSFTQEYFDPLCINLANYPIARAVAASSAFPGLLTALTINSEADRCGYNRRLG